MDKNKIMLMTDSQLRTGFGSVSDNIAYGLAEAGFSVSFLGWGFRHEEAITRKNYTLLPCGNDPFGQDVLPYYLQQIKPEVLITQADTRMIAWLPQLFRQVPAVKPTWVFYVVIDGSIWDYEGKRNKWPKNWTNIIKFADKVVAMSKFGQKILEANGVQSETIYHGVDTTRFLPVSDEVRKEIKQKVGLGADTFVFGGVFKNMLRKCPEKYIQAFKIFLESKELTQRDKDRCVLLLHTNPQPQTAGEFDLVEHAVDADLQIGKNVVFSNPVLPPDRMPIIYQTMDVFLTLGTMEGFCTKPETKIITEDGLKEIRCIKEGEKVYTHNAKYKKVLKTFKRHYKGKLFGIKRFKYGERIWLTPNHPVLTKENNNIVWKRADGLKEGQLVAFPIPEKHNSLTELNLKDYLVGDYIYEDGRIYSIGRNQTRVNYKHPSTSFKEKFEITKEFMRFLGYYLAEGCASNGTIVLAFNANKDKDCIDDATKFVQSLGLHYNISYLGNVARLTFNSKIFGKLLRIWFGSGAKNKRLPKWIFETSDSMLKELIIGFHRGDGSIFISKRGKIEIDFTTTSNILLHQIYMILLRLGISSTVRPNSNSIQIHKIEDKNKFLELLGKQKIDMIKHGKIFYKTDDRYSWFKIENITVEEYNNDVYNLYVEDDNSYTTESFTVHNCLPIIEAMSCGLPSVGVNSCTMPELFGDSALLSEVPTYKNGRKIYYSSYNGVEGEVVDPWDVAKKMVQLYKDESLRKELGMKATERAVKTFDWTIIRKQWVDYVNKLVVKESDIPAEWAKLLEETKT